LVEDFFREQTSAHELPSVTARLDQYFIPPIPWRVFCVLVALPGKAWAIYLVLWRLARMYKRMTITVTSVSLRGLGLTHDQKTRGLDTLERAGLLTIERQVGKNPMVTLCPLQDVRASQEPLA
jgi:hypothetical protein